MMNRTFDTDPDPTRDLYVIYLPHLVEGIYRLNVVSMGTDPTTSVSTSSTFSMISSERSFVKSYRWKRVEDWHVMDDKFLYQTHNIETRITDNQIEAKLQPSWKLSVFIFPLEVTFTMKVFFCTTLLHIRSAIHAEYGMLALSFKSCGKSSDTVFVNCDALFELHSVSFPWRLFKCPTYLRNMCFD
jgi:hypothetical protein